MNKQQQGSASAATVQYRPRILCRGSNNTNGTQVGLNNTNHTSNGIAFVEDYQDLIISPNEQLQIEFPIMGMDDGVDQVQVQPESILLNSLLAPTEVNNGVMIDTGLTQHIPQSELVYVKLDDGQITDSTDSAQNIIITLNESQLDGLTGKFQQTAESIIVTPSTSTDPFSEKVLPQNKTHETSTPDGEQDETGGLQPQDKVQDTDTEVKIETGAIQPSNGESETEKQDISNVMDDLIQKVEAEVSKQQKTPKSKRRAGVSDRRKVKAESVPAPAPPDAQLPLLWKDDIGFLPGTEFAFSVNEAGCLVLHCPVLPIKAKMDGVVRMLNFKRSEKAATSKVAAQQQQEGAGVRARMESAKHRTSVNQKNALRKSGLVDSPNKILQNGVNPKSVQIYKNKVSPIMSSTVTISASAGNKRPSDKLGQVRRNEMLKSETTIHEFVKPNPVKGRIVNRARHSAPATKSETISAATNVIEGNPRNSKPRQSEPTAATSSIPDVLVKSGKIPKSKLNETGTTVKTTLCLNCATLGEVADFLDGKYCSPICKRTVRMLAAEESKSKNHRLEANGDKKTLMTLDKKVLKKKSSANAAPSTPSETKAEPPTPSPAQPIFYAKKTTIAPIELGGGQTIVPQFLPQPHPRLDVNLQEFMRGHSHNPGTYKNETMEHNVVELRIEDQGSSEQISVCAVEDNEEEEEEDVKESQKKSSVRAPPRKHRKRASLTMRKRYSTSGQASKTSNPRRFSKEEMNIRSNPYGERSRQLQLPQQIQSSTKPNIEEFNWINYLKETKSKAAPSRMFKEPIMPLVNAFKVGMCLEAIDPVHQSLFCVVHVVEVLGFRLRLRFTGYAEVYDFWVNADSSEIFPCGWCEEHGQELLGPPDHDYDKRKPFNWHQYIVDVDASPAQRESFAIVKEDVPLENTSEVKIGMKLEAVDLKNINYICVATVGNVIGDRFLIHFDSWDNLFDYWTDLTSPFIHPVGWCEANGRELVPPQWGDERDTGRPFVWAEYLKETNSIPMPPKLFRPLPPVNFKPGMKLECVDKRTPSLIRVATVAEADSHFITIHFDGWDSKFDYPIYELSPDIHRIGWCAETMHPLQPPPPPAKSPYWKKKKCPVYGCLGIGNIDGPKFPTHDSEQNCPYADEHYLTDFILGDRLVSYNPTPVVSSAPRRKSGSRRSSNASRTKSQGGTSRSSAKRSSARNDDSERKPPQRVSQRGKRASVQEDKEITMVPEVDTSEVQITVPPSKKARRSATEEPSAESAVQEVEKIEPPSDDPTTAASSRKSNRASSGRARTQARRERKSVASEKTAAEHTEQKQSNQQPETPVSTVSATLANTSSQSVPSTSKFIQPQIPPHIQLAAVPTMDQPMNELPPNFDAHIQGLHRLVAGLNPTIVSQWGVNEVAAFVVKVGCSTGVSQKLIIEHKLDGESFLLLKQHDILTYGFPYGPAMKIANALDIINASQ